MVNAIAVWFYKGQRSVQSTSAVTMEEEVEMTHSHVPVRERLDATEHRSYRLKDGVLEAFFLLDQEDPSLKILAGVLDLGCESDTLGALNPKRGNLLTLMEDLFNAGFMSGVYCERSSRGDF
jgi:hypothetical protein